MSIDSTAIISKLNSRVKEFPEDKCIHQLFEEQVKKKPDAIAVIYNTISLTFKQLNDRSNKVAHILQKKHSLPPGGMVAVIMDRSEELIISLLGVMKAGGVYLPIDPNHPVDRIRYILDNSHCTTAIISEKYFARTSPLFDSNVLNITNITELEKENLPCTISSTDLAYVLYTSGSTGKPKGVMIEHRSFVNMALDLIDLVKVQPSDIISQFASQSFDVSLSEFFLALLSGTTLCIAGNDVRSDTYKFEEFLRENGVTIVSLPPSYLSNLNNDRFTTVRVMITAGEKANVQDAVELSKKCTYINAYGPTEAAVYATWYTVDPAKEYDKSISIGVPVSNLKIHILDENKNVQPVGVPGELCIAGCGLARGYLNNEELTQDKFIDNPFVPGEKLYKTGDVAAYCPDGTIEYLGRNDDQVKIRGFRVELGEIESHLHKHKGVKENVVVVKEKTLSDKKLVSYLVLDKEWIDEVDRNYYEEYQKSSVEKLKSGNEDDKSVDPVQKKRTYDRILSLKPDRVLEIGGGQGLFLSELAPYCSSYYAAGYAEEELTSVNNLVQKEKEKYSHVHISHNKPGTFSGLESADFDTIILNSAVGLLPDIDTLEKVLTQAAEHVGENGSIVITNVKNYNLLEARHTNELFNTASGDTAPAELKRDIDKKLFLEHELSLSAEFFYSLKNFIPRVSYVDIQYHPENSNGEMAGYRYDVVLHIGKYGSYDTVVNLEWNKDIRQVEEIHTYLTEQKPPALQVTRIPNAHFKTSRQVGAFVGTNEYKNVQAFKEKAGGHLQHGEIEAKTFMELPVEGYNAQLIWAGRGNEHLLTAVYVKQDLFSENYNNIYPQVPVNTFLFKKMQNYSNNPRKSFIQTKMTGELKDYLKGNVPDYMVPAHFVFMEKFPLTINGKVDKKNLPEPLDSVVTAEYAEATTELESKLADLYSKVFGLEKIGINDNFFDLGGHSLLAAQVATRISEEFNIIFPVENVFQYPDIAQIAEVINSMEEVQEKKEPVIKPVHRTFKSKKLPIRFEQLMYWAMFKSDKYTNNVAEAFSISGELDINTFSQALNLALQREKAVWNPFGAFLPMMIVKEPGTINLPLFSIEDEPDKETRLKELVKEVLHTNFNLSKAPLVRAALVKQSADLFSFLICFPHIICDIGTLNRFIKELTAIYDALKNDREIPPKTTDLEVADLAAMEREEKYLALAEKDGEYWKQKILGTKTIKMPKEFFLNSTEPSGRAIVEKLDLSDSILTSLGRISKERNTSSQMGLLTILNIALHLLSGENDLAVSMAVDKVITPEEQKVFTVHAYPVVVRSKVQNDIRFIDVLEETTNYILNGFDHLNCHSLLPHAYANTEKIGDNVEKTLKEAKSLSNMITFFMGKARLKRDIFSSMAIISKGNSNLNKRKLMKELQDESISKVNIMTPLFNVLPDFFEENKIVTETGLTVESSRDIKVSLPAEAFEGNGKSGDGVTLNFYLTRDRQNKAAIHIFGGGLNEKALAAIKNKISFLLERVIKNPGVTIQELR